MGYYLIFCLATAITCSIVIFKPILEILKYNAIEHDFVKHPIKAHTIMFVGFTILAPAVFLVILSNTRTERFKASLLKSLLN